MPPTPTPDPPPHRPAVKPPRPGTKDHAIGESYNYIPPRRSAFRLTDPDGKRPEIAVEIDGHVDEEDAIVDAHSVEVEGKWRKDGALHTRRVVDRSTGAIIVGKRPSGQILILALFLVVFVVAAVFIVVGF
jgi:hypothetical protein